MPIDRIKFPDNTVEPLRDNTKQDILVSGENIKTINGESILGSGNITIEGGGGGDMSAYEVKANKVTTISASSTNEQYPSAKAVYDAIMAGGTVEEDIPDVIFIDYDGTVTNSYSRDDFAFLTEMPANPTHDGLTSQGWNWTLADAKDYVSKYGRLIIGQMYVTSDGKTRFGITIDESTLNTVSFGLTGRGTVEIDWGDGNTETTTQTTLTHTYTSAGDYVISFSRDTAGGFNGFGANSNAKRLNPAMLRWAHVGSNITELGYDTFRNCSNAEYITIPHGVTRAYSCPFEGCNSLKSLVIPDTFVSATINAFANCYSLKYISLGPNFNVKGAYFVNCYSLIEVNIPSVVTSLNDTTFDRCINLRVVTLPDGMTKIGYQLFRDNFKLRDINLPDSLTDIGYNIFEMCHSLKRLTFPAGVSIGTAVCTECAALETVTVSSNIGNNDFNRCSSLKNLTIGTGTETIGNNAFERCYSIESIIFPEGVISIGSTAFSNCTRLKRVSFPNSLTSIGGNAFQHCKFLQKVIFGEESSVAIGNYAFANCQNLISIDISHATSIGQYAFSDCYNLESIELPAQLTSINNYAFSGCVRLHSLSVPASVTSIATGAFSGCTNMRHLYMFPTTPPSAGGNFFANAPDGLTIHVPAGTLSAYQSATNWSAHASKMVEMDE